MNILDLLFSPAQASEPPPQAGVGGGLSGGLGMANVPLPPPRPTEGVIPREGDGSTPEAVMAGGRPDDVKSGVLARLPSALRAKQQQAPSGAGFGGRLAAGMGAKGAGGKTFWEAAANGFGPSFSAAMGADGKAKKDSLDQQMKMVDMYYKLGLVDRQYARAEGGGVTNRVARGNAEPRASRGGGSQPRSYKPADPAMVENRILRNIEAFKKQRGLAADDEAPPSRRMPLEKRQQIEAEAAEYERQQRARYPDLYPQGDKPPPQPTEARPADTPQPTAPAPAPTQPSTAPAPAPKRLRYNLETGDFE